MDTLALDEAAALEVLVDEVEEPPTAVEVLVPDEVATDETEAAVPEHAP